MMHSRIRELLSRCRCRLRTTWHIKASVLEGGIDLHADPVMIDAPAGSFPAQPHGEPNWMQKIALRIVCTLYADGRHADTRSVDGHHRTRRH